MAKNPTGIGICGVVVGIIIGAGAIMYTQHYTVVAHLAGMLVGEESLLAFRGIDPDLGDTYKRRAIVTFERLTNNASGIVDTPRYPTVPTQGEEETTVEATAQCEELQRVVVRMREAAKRIIPTTSLYTQLRAQMTAVFEGSLQECPIVEVQEQAMIQVKKTNTPVQAQPRVNNHCEQYEKTSQRYTRCIANEREGQRYVGKQ